jgi:hypothetical protein
MHKKHAKNSTEGIFTRGAVFSLPPYKIAVLFKP